MHLYESTAKLDQLYLLQYYLLNTSGLASFPIVSIHSPAYSLIYPASTSFIWRDFWYVWSAWMKSYHLSLPIISRMWMKFWKKRVNVFPLKSCRLVVLPSGTVCYCEWTVRCDWLRWWASEIQRTKSRRWQNAAWVVEPIVCLLASVWRVQSASSGGVDAATSVHVFSGVLTCDVFLILRAMLRSVASRSGPTRGILPTRPVVQWHRYP